MSFADRKALLELILEFSFERRRVTLAHGGTSDFYLDLRRTLMRAPGQRLAGELLLEALYRPGRPRVAALGGMAVGAVPLVSAVLAAAGRKDPASDEAALLGFFVRKEAKPHGLGRRVEGAPVSGMDVALLEDTTTTGASALEALRVVQAEGARVRRVLCLVDRGEGARQAFAEHGLELEALFGRDDLPLG